MRFLIFILALFTVVAPVHAERPAVKKRVLLLGQQPDSHPFSTHEYLPAMALLAKMLQRVDGLQPIVVNADNPWKDGPELLDGADGVVVFLSQGAKWIQEDKVRLQAFQRLAKRGGGFSCLHWGMGTKQAAEIPAFVNLFGGCHGGPDRRYKVVDVTALPAENAHPILTGIKPFEVHEEFYFKLKFAKPKSDVVPLIQVPIEGETHTVSWAWTRPDGGRAFGFSGGHFHKNWELPAYRRLATQGILWTLNREIPKSGFNVDVAPAALRLKPRKAAN